MKKARASIFLSVFLCGAVLVSAAWADVKLSAPKTSGGAGIFELVEKRASGTRDNFPKGDISLEELSTILWAATGRNRGGNGWTVPTAGGLPPYVKIYAVKKDGVFMYDWKAHSLTEISTNDARGDITSDNFVKASPIVLIFVSDTNDLGSMGKLNVGNSLAYTAAGAMSQNAYLAADALGISTRYMVSMNADAVKRVLKLNPANVPLCILPLGKR